jgi:hypothetical protein
VFFSRVSQVGLGVWERVERRVGKILGSARAW